MRRLDDHLPWDIAMNRDEATRIAMKLFWRS